jgi:hypothetical protein
MILSPMLLLVMHLPMWGDDTDKMAEKVIGLFSAFQPECAVARCAVCWRWPQAQPSPRPHPPPPSANGKRPGSEPHQLRRPRIGALL